MNAACGFSGVDAKMFELEATKIDHRRAAAVCAKCRIGMQCRVEAAAMKASGVFGGALYMSGRKLREIALPDAPEPRDGISRMAVVHAAELHSNRFGGADTPERQQARRAALRGI